MGRQSRTTTKNGSYTFRGVKQSAIEHRWKTTSNWNHPYYYQLLDDAHTAIDTGYNSAIAHYEAQRSAFISQINMSSKEAIKEFEDTALEWLNQQLSKELQASVAQRAEQLFYEVGLLFVEEVADGLRGQPNAALQKLQSSLAKYYGPEAQTKKERIYANMKKSLEEYITTIYGKDSYGTFAQELAARLGVGTNNQATIYNIGGMMRQLILSHLISNKDVFDIKQKDFVNALKGYLQEEAMAQALSNILKQYNLGVAETGSGKNDKGQQIKVDLAITDFGTNVKVQSMNAKETGAGTQFLTDIINRLDKLGTSYSAEGTATFYGGIQSKSWVAPWSDIGEGKANTTFLDFGGGSQFFPTGEDVYYWHGGVKSIMSNLTAAIGYQNVLFSTGNKIYWTSELLKEFRKQNYVLAFHYSYVNEKLSDSGSMSMQQHTD